MSGRFILQRDVPHYRVPLFKRLHERYGLRVLTPPVPPAKTGLKLGNDELGDIIVPFPMVFPQPDNPYRADFSARQLIEEHKPDLIISEFNLNSSSAWKLPLARRVGRLPKLVFWAHGWSMERDFRGPRNLLSQYGRLPVMAAADVVATYTQEGAAWVRRWLPGKTVIALGNALDHGPKREAAARAEPRRHGRPQLLAIGRMRADKGFDRVIDIHRRLQQRLPDAALTLVGDGPERARLEQLAGPALGRSVHVTGPLYDETTLAEHFLGADVYVLAGAAGLGVNHALAYALPVVAFPRSPEGPFHHPEIEYVVPNRSGLLVEPYDNEAMAATIAEAYNSGHLAKLRESLKVDPVAPSIDSVVEQFGAVLQAVDPT